MKNSYVVVFLLIIIGACKPSEAVVKKSEVDQELINFLFRNYTGEKPSASFVVIKDGEMLACQSFGYAHLENKTIANCETNYRLASVTKQFTAMGVLILIDQGKLNYETKLTEVIPEFPEYGQEITIKNLLTHRSGLQDYAKLYPEDSEKQLVDKEVLNLLMAQDSLLFPANTQFRYSNSGYAVLAMIIERVSGKTFKEFMTEAIFEKLGMTNSTVYLSDSQIKNRAYGYKVKENNFEKKDQNIWSAIQGDGGIYSSVSDYAKWDKALYTETLIREDLLQDAFSNWDENGTTDGKGYGFGWQIEEIKGIKYLAHGGSTIGFLNTTMRIPSERLTVAIFTNNGNLGGLQRKALFLASHFSNGRLPMPAEIVLRREVEEHGIENVATKLKEIKVNSNDYDISEDGLVGLGFSYFNSEPEKAKMIFETITVEYPDFFGGYYGLGQYYAYKAEDKNELAIEYYKKVVDMNPVGRERLMNHAKNMIKKLSE
ncbi:class A beta-lactamase-related serine hydrolase [Euzebyella marina]|uniref:Class A beta-lactamase-related serine hydrolase n=1 Tax=Euzebyella marina TaxID=1761453 RepID=A0A3G2L4D3_9FLAO|nr:serine hydrolase domain-containing protein [Euzebyella marina]AYN67108.1 class A beta-lactamase-related serine hydrolase [Euzebyella marina]